VLFFRLPLVGLGPQEPSGYDYVLGFWGKAPAANIFLDIRPIGAYVRAGWWKVAVIFFCHIPKKWGVRYPHSKRWGVRGYPRTPRKLRLWSPPLECGHTFSSGWRLAGTGLTAGQPVSVQALWKNLMCSLMCSYTRRNQFNKAFRQ